MALIVNPRTGMSFPIKSDAGIRLLHDFYVGGGDLPIGVELELLTRVMPDGLVKHLVAEGGGYTVNLGLLRNFLKHADIAYRGGEALVSDEEYDSLMRIYEQRRGLPEGEGAIEIEVVEGVKAQGGLPFLMTSLDKWIFGHSSEGEFSRWWSKWCEGGGVCSFKLDGVSALYYRDIGTGEHFLYSRGGWNISYLIKVLGLPEIPVGVGVRGEIIMPRENWSKWQGSGYKTSRSAVAGQINAKEGSSNLALLTDCEMIFYTLYGSQSIGNIVADRELIVSWGLKIVPGWFIEAGLDFRVVINTLREWLKQARIKSRWDIDGLVVCSREGGGGGGEGGGNPEWAIAFKENELNYLTVVREVRWNISKTGALKPIIEVEPVEFADGKTVERVTGHNAKYIMDKGIGPGAKIRIANRGEVIPGVESVDQAAEMSGLPLEGTFSWRGVDIVPTEGRGESENYQQIEFFMKSVGARNIGSALVVKMEGGLIYWFNLVNKWRMDGRKVVEMDSLATRVGPVILARSLESLSDALDKCTPEQFIAGTGLLGAGIGETRLSVLFKQYPGMWRDASVDVDKISECRGFSKILAFQIAEYWPRWIEFWESLPITPGFANRVAAVEVPAIDDRPKDARILGKMFYITNGKDDKISDFILANGGSMSSDGKSSKIAMIIDSSNGTKINTKIIKAKEENKYITANDFKKIFSL